jgi:3-phytase
MKSVSAVILLLLAACSATPPTPALPNTQLVQIGGTEPVADDPDDPAVWIHPQDPSLNSIIGTNKVEKPNGGLLVFDMKGKILQKITDLARPNNVDIEQDVTRRPDI